MQKKQPAVPDYDDSELVDDAPDDLAPAVAAELAEEARSEADEALAPVAALLDPVDDDGDAYEPNWSGRMDWSRGFHRRARQVEAQWLATLSKAECYRLKNGIRPGVEPLESKVTVYAWDKHDTGEQPTCAQMRRYAPPRPPIAVDATCEHDWQYPAENVAVRQPTAKRTWKAIPVNAANPTGLTKDVIDDKTPGRYSGTAYQTAGARQCEICGALGYRDLETGEIKVSPSQYPRAVGIADAHAATPKHRQACKSFDEMTDRDFVMAYDADGNITTVAPSVWDAIADETQLDPVSLVHAATVAVQALGIPRRYQRWGNNRHGKRVRNGATIRYSSPTGKELEALIGKSRQAAQQLFKQSGVERPKLISLLKRYGMAPDDLYVILNTRFPPIGALLARACEPVTQPKKTLLLGTTNKVTQRKRSR